MYLSITRYLCGQKWRGPYFSIVHEGSSWNDVEACFFVGAHTATLTVTWWAIQHAISGLLSYHFMSAAFTSMSDAGTIRTMTSELVTMICHRTKLKDLPFAHGVLSFRNVNSLLAVCRHMWLHWALSSQVSKEHVHSGWCSNSHCLWFMECLYTLMQKKNTCTYRHSFSSCMYHKFLLAIIMPVLSECLMDCPFSHTISLFMLVCSSRCGLFVGIWHFLWW